MLEHIVGDECKLTVGAGGGLDFTDAEILANRGLTVCALLDIEDLTGRAGVVDDIVVLVPVIRVLAVFVDELNGLEQKVSARRKQQGKDGAERLRQINCQNPFPQKYLTNT